jgi:osmotically-inducible protein OsmY
MPWLGYAQDPAEREDAMKAFDAQDFKDVTVKVKNGVVRLTGTVLTGTRRLEAAVLARSIQGVRAVEDDLRVAAA